MKQEWAIAPPYARKHFTGINNVETIVSAQKHNHPGDLRLVELARNADLLVHDARYTAEELQQRRGWGHSSFDQAMQVAEMAGVKRLAFTHHDPERDDEFLQRIEKLCQKRFPNAVLAREGMEITI
jgi:ribonuclease BN (tRNA processing enzyme)